MTANATEVKNRFGEFMEKARHEPVTVKKTGRDYIVMLSKDEFDRLQKFEDMIWAERAMEAEKSGFIGHEAAMEFINRRLAEE
jgi:prevent-host-death family protein